MASEATCSECLRKSNEDNSRVRVVRCSLAPASEDPAHKKLLARRISSGWSPSLRIGRQLIESSCSPFDVDYEGEEEEEDEKDENASKKAAKRRPDPDSEEDEEDAVRFLHSALATPC